MIGKTLGRYEILGKLGEGGMASVYWARDPKLNRQVAVKILPPWCKNDPGHLGRFRREVRLLADISHPNIVSIFDFGEAEEYVFYAMEFLSGGSLADEIARRGRLDYKAVLKLGHEMAGALDCIHRLGICHRDLKPHNILRSETGAFKLADFGLGKGEEFETITRAGELIGTLRYLPPEGLEGEPLDATADLFQLGLVLYEAACGARPYRGSNAVEILRSYTKDTPPNPSACCPDVPQAFDNLVWNLVQMRKKDRYPDVQAVLGDLARLDRGGSVRRRATTIRPPTRAPVVDKASMPIAVPPPRPKHGLPPRVLAAMALMILMGLFLIRPGRTKAIPPVPDVPIDIAVRVGEHHALVTWRTRLPSKGILEYGTRGSDNLIVAEEPGAVTTHTIAISDLDPGKEYTLSVRGPEGSRPSQRAITPTTFSVDLVRAETESGQGQIEWRSSQPTRSKVRIRRYNTMADPITVPEDWALSHLLRFEGIGPGVEFAISVDASNDVEETRSLDVCALVEAQMAPLLSPPRDEEMAGKNAFALRMLNRGELKYAKATFEDHEWRREVPKRLAVLGFYLGNPHYPLEERVRVYRGIRLFQALEAQHPELEAKLGAGLTSVLPLSWMQTDAAAVREGQVLPLALTSQESLIADPRFVPLGSGHHVITSKKVEFTVPVGATTWSAAELRVNGSVPANTLLDADINGAAKLVLMPPPGESTTDAHLVQRIPVELVRTGSNHIVFTLRPIPGVAKAKSATATLTSGEVALERGDASPSEIRVTASRGGRH